MRANRPSGRFAAASAVLIVHGLLVLLFLRADHSTEANAPQELVRTRILHLLTLPRQRRRVPTRGTSRRRPAQSRSATASPRPAVALPAEPSKVSAPHHPERDWHAAADEVARSLTGWRGTKVHPGSGEHPSSPYRDCEPQPQFAWDPQPKRVGLIDHWLPYLRLGNHCIVALGMFGCAIGRLPAPNGQLFDRALAGKTTQDTTPAVRTWPRGEPRGLCRPVP